MITLIVIATVLVAALIVGITVAVIATIDCWCASKPVARRRL